MADFYTNMAATATRLIDRFGTTVTFPRTTGGSIDPVTGEVTAGTDNTQTTKGLLKRFPDNLIDGTRIQKGDRVLIVNSSVEPLMDDRPEMNSESLGVPQSIESVDPTGTALVYFIHLRR